MRKTIGCAAALAVATVPAAAIAQDKGGKSPYCVPKTEGYKANGTFVSGALTQTAGADTAKRGDDRYSGDVVVDVKKANHAGQAGEQSFTLTNARVRFHPGKDTDPGAGDRVKLAGKITKFGKKCATSTTTVTVKKVDIKAKKS